MARWSAFPDAKSAAEACGRQVIATLEQVLAGRDYATLALSGGSTPRLMFRWLAAARFPWRQVHMFWVDERPVPPADPASNYKLAMECFIGPAGIPSANIHRIHAELLPEVAARNYAAEIRRFFGLEEGEMPRFDVLHRGIGPEGHTASLFPGEPLIDDRERIAAAVYVKKLAQWRITLLPGPLLAAASIVVLAAGADKAEAVRTALEGACEPKLCPAQLGRGREAAWFLDEPAARLLKAASER